MQFDKTSSWYDNVIVTAVRADSNISINARAVPDDKDDYFVNEVKFDQPGRWKIRTESPEFGIGSAVPTLYVDAVNIVGEMFDPGSMTIEAGTTVRFSNGDVIKHEVAFADTRIDDSGILEPGDTFDVTFPDTGEFVFVYGPHPGMSGRIIVE